MSTQNDKEPDELGLSAALERELKARYGQPVFIPAEVDNAVAAQVRRHLSRAGGRRWILLWRWPAAAVAALVAAALGFWTIEQRRVPLTARADINRDGQVDILDAFTFTRSLQRSATDAGALPDINGDGIVDRRDADAIAAVAVRLNGGPG